MSKSKVAGFGLLLLTFLSAGFACFGNYASASDQESFVVDEIMYNPGSGAKWVEMAAEKDISFELASNGQIKDFYLATKKNKNTGDYTSYAVYSQSGIDRLPKGTVVIITNNLDAFGSNLPDNVVVLKTSASLDFLQSDSSTNYAAVSYSDDNKATWHGEIFYGAYGKTAQGNSLERIPLTDGEWQESNVAGGTPGYENFTGSDAFDDGSEEDDDAGAGCIQSVADMKFNELFPYPDAEEQEYVELKNFGTFCADLSGWMIEDAGKHKYVFPAGTIIESGDVLSIARDFYLNSSTSETVYLFDQSGKEVDKVSYDIAIKGYSLSFDEENWIWTSIPTPGQENEFDEDGTADEPVGGTGHGDAEYAIRLNELLPHPKGGKKSEEYIELYNGEGFAINLEGWILKDASKSKFIFPKGFQIKAGEYLVIYRSAFKFALNDAGQESVYLFDPDGNMISEADYEKAKEDVSYSFDGKAWRWSRFQTPEKGNKFGKALKIKIDKIRTGYVGMPVAFEASVASKKKSKKRNRDEDDPKFHWDFGDKGKSYLQSVSHTFQKTGNYRVKLSVDNGVESVVKSFKIKIKKYPKLAVEISGILPNPADNDTGKEWVEVKNNSSKNINLNGWKIATGQKTLVNHAIFSDALAAPGEAIRLTRENALFFLNNKSATIELRYPNGKTASHLAYGKDKIVEGEICHNINGSCNWSLSQEEDGDGIDEQGDDIDGMRAGEGETDDSDVSADGQEAEAAAKSVEILSGDLSPDPSASDEDSENSAASLPVNVPVIEQQHVSQVRTLVGGMAAAIDSFIDRVL